jgi:hypothetical protein
MPETGGQYHRNIQAIRIHKYGGAEELVYEDAPMPEINPDDFL